MPIHTPQWSSKWLPSAPLALLLGLGGGLLLAPPLHLAAAPSASLPGLQSPPRENLAIVVNRQNPMDGLSLSALRKIFLGERSHWPDGRRITLVLMDPGTPERAAVLRELCQMNESDYSRHILQDLFRGELQVSPKTLAAPAGVRKFVFNVPGAIGYVRAIDADDSVKVLRVDGLLPDDRDYPLRIEAAAH
jgi:hypothetical protein